jgi:hypothetical protein
MRPASKERQMKPKTKVRKSKGAGRYKVYTRPELYADDRPAATWLLRIGIVLTMLGIALVFRQPLHQAFVSVLGV